MAGSPLKGELKTWVLFSRLDRKGCLSRLFLIKAKLEQPSYPGPHRPPLCCFLQTSGCLGTRQFQRQNQLKLYGSNSKTHCILRKAAGSAQPFPCKAAGATGRGDLAVDSAQQVILSLKEEPAWQAAIGLSPSNWTQRWQ